MTSMAMSTAAVGVPNFDALTDDELRELAADESQMGFVRDIARRTLELRVTEAEPPLPPVLVFDPRTLATHYPEFCREHFPDVYARYVGGGKGGGE